ncbi:FadR family transcriptional regulator [Jeotgalibacillus sp. S-D1]|nr:FadR family transcriptional regulator [Jeotgalibacillus sp. S-D1]
MIQRDRLTSGDRLPSERELSDRLGVGRSSVREAFRALELLGLIETRHGEGTFLRDFRDHRLVELLGMFILQNGQAENDVVEMKDWVESASFNRLFLSGKDGIEHLFDTIHAGFNKGEISTFTHFKSKLIKASGNRLAYKVWLVLHDFDTEGKKEILPLSEELIYDVKNALLTGNMEFIRAICTASDQ